ncbi:trehalose-phosphatase [Corynebacterium sp. sy017]|uniref:trehalose-phosphatase n=1 Tax=unclassified Corynebacterium TaxID=2624378 RepID=UPI001186B817|nr:MULTISPECIES: trehalose-phosphatase [unclassified Corynebacterium]MBP3088591.1 trehalose-phosphatase [Corynebacterium sp. sy017]TSD91885.1 trehalose-phosphatase [Corynebacterium sp. SY003]
MAPITLDELARTKQLLVVSDFDGTLAGFSTDPATVPVNQQAAAALHQLAELPNTTVAILSGRDLDGLRAASGFSEKSFVLAGSHGAQTSEPYADILASPCLNDAQQQALAAVSEKLEELAQKLEGAFVEHKPFHRVLHTLKATDQKGAAALLAEALELDIPGIHAKPGKSIVEFSAVTITKGSWISQAQSYFDASATVFLGDDTTDEDGFAVLGAGDLSVKVGNPQVETAARLRVADIAGVAELLTQLAGVRTQALG